MASGAASAHVKGSVLYFFLFMAYGCVSPFMPLIWRSKGLSEHQVGVLAAIRPVVGFFATPVICAFADRRGIQQQVLYVAFILYAVTLPSVLFADPFLAVGAVEASSSLSNSPIGSLIDSAIRNAFGADGYGMLRLWGAVGFGTASLLAGYVSDAHGGSYTGVMIVFLANILVALAASTGVRVGRHEDDDDSSSSSSSSSSKPDVQAAVSSGDGRLVGFEGDRVAPGGAESALERKDLNPRSRTSAEGVSAGGDAGREELDGSGRKVPGTAAATAAAAAADNSLDSLNDNSDDDLEDGNEEDEAQVHATLLPRSAGVASARGKRVSDSNGSRREGALVAKAEGRGQGGVLMAVRIMVSTDQSASFFMAVGLSGMGAGVIDTFLFIRLEELGGSHVLCGLARLIMCVAEVPFFYLSGPLIRKMGARGVIALTEVAYLTRFIYYSALQEPWWVLPAEVLHGLTFAAMWAATTDYAHEIAPAHLRTTIQGAVSGLHWGLGFGLGAMLGGVLYARLGAQRCFAVSAALPSLSLVLLVLPVARQWLGRYASSRRGLSERSGTTSGGWAGAGGVRGNGGGGDGRSSYELVAVAKGSHLILGDRADDDEYDGGGGDDHNGVNKVNTTDRENTTFSNSNTNRDRKSYIGNRVGDDDLEDQRRQAV